LKKTLEIEKLLKAQFPQAELDRIEFQEAPDFDGEPSIFVTVYFKDRPSRDEMREAIHIVDKFRTWLANREDDRFPYFRYLTEREKAEEWAP
jgi:hypothetical protein